MQRTLLGVLVIATVAAAPAPKSKWWGHVQVLASDAMEGRDTGSPGHKRAAEYVAAQFKAAGLETAGTDGYMQPVAFNTRRIIEAQSHVALVRNGKTEALTLGDDAAINVRVDPAPSVDAPLVFAGHGLTIPEQKINDLAGLDVKGAVVVFLATTPASIPGPLRAHFGSNAERWKGWKAAGAIGAIGIQNPRNMDIPWERSTLARLQPAMTLSDPALYAYAGMQFAAAMNPARAEKLFTGSGHTFEEMLALDNAGKPLPHFALPARVKATVRVERAEVISQNIAGILRGSDPRRRNEYVALSAHVDHLGIGGPGNSVNGDRIYNGAMDNASGVAAILEIARQLHESPAKPARSILFVAVTGEEKGDLGSLYFVGHPTVPRASIVADVNSDMFLPLYPLNMLSIIGIEESDLSADVAAAAQKVGVSVQPDPEPQRSFFTRSDQYSFVKAGIPAIFPIIGFRPNSPEAATVAKWTRERYHAPSDDLNQPIDLQAADKFVDAMRETVLHIANRTDRPRWNDTSFFKRFAQP